MVSIEKLTLILLAFLMAYCTEVKSESESESETESETEKKIDSDPYTIAPPLDVNGTYLFCADLSQSAADLPDDKKKLGCSLYADKDNKALNLSQEQVKVLIPQILLKQQDKYFEVTDIYFGSSWHVEFMVETLQITTASAILYKPVGETVPSGDAPIFNNPLYTGSKPPLTYDIQIIESHDKDVYTLKLAPLDGDATGKFNLPQDFHSATVGKLTKEMFDQQVLNEQDLCASFKDIPGSTFLRQELVSINQIPLPREQRSLLDADHIIFVCMFDIYQNATLQNRLGVIQQRLSKVDDPNPQNFFTQ